MNVIQKILKFLNLGNANFKVLASSYGFTRPGIADQTVKSKLCLQTAEAEKTLQQTVLERYR